MSGHVLSQNEFEPSQNYGKPQLPRASPPEPDPTDTPTPPCASAETCSAKAFDFSCAFACSESFTGDWASSSSTAQSRSAAVSGDGGLRN